jgi:prevent-host-death family protein
VKKKQVNLHAAKTSLSRLVDEAMEGHDIVIAKAGKPMVRLVPVARETRRHGFGADKGKIWISDDFDAPLPPDVLRAFGIDP